MYWPGEGQSCGMLIPGERSQQDRQTVRVRIRKRLQQKGVDDSENRRVGADADSERGHDDQR